MKVYLRLFGFLKPYWHIGLLVLLIALLASFLGVVSIQVIGLIIDQVTNIGDTGQSSMTIMSHNPLLPYVNNFIKEGEGKFTILCNLSLLYLCFYILTGSLNNLKGFMISKLGAKLILSLRNAVYHHLQTLKLSYFEDKKTGDIMSRLVNDVNALQQAIVAPFIGLIGDLISIVWILYFCLRWDWSLTIPAMVIAPLIAFGSFKFGGKLHGRARKIREKIGELNSLLHDSLSGLMVTKSFVREDYELNKFVEVNNNNYQANVEIYKTTCFYWLTNGFLQSIGTTIVLLYGGLKVLKGILSAGGLVVFLQYIPRLYSPMINLSRFYSMIQQALASIERVFELLDTQDYIEIEGAIEMPAIRGDIEIDNVYYVYNDNTEALFNINIKIDAGKMVALVGPTGGGKTTLAQLIPRFYDPTQGSIRIDGTDIREFTLSSLRKQIGIVLQEAYLFNTSIKENIAYGRLDATEEEIYAAARTANIHDFITTLPDGYNTRIGERGSKLSGGERQRISIARSVIANPSILILDEATSSVDTQTENLIQQAINNLVKNRTTIVIAHRLSTILNADQIIVIDNGSIIETGTHESLLSHGGLYKELYNAQFINHG